MRCIDWGVALMVIEITKKHIIVAITCLAIGVAIGVGTVMLVNHESKNMGQTETTSAQVKPLRYLYAVASYGRQFWLPFFR